MACGMLSHLSSKVVRSYWILAETCCRDRTTQTCSMGDMSGEYGGHGRSGNGRNSPNTAVPRFDQAVDCGQWNIVPLLFNGWILVGTGTRCQSRASQTGSMGDMSGEYGGHGRTGIFSAEWHDNGPQDLVMVSLCIQIAIDGMQLCLLSLAYACQCLPIP